MCETKICVACGIEKELLAFQKKRYGYANTCRECMKSPVPEGMKRCSKCGNVKELDEFSNNKKSKDGKRSECKVCKRGSDKKYRESHKEEVAACKKQWQKDNKEKIAEYKKKWREDNPEYDKKYRESHKEEVAERSKKWREDNPEKVAAQDARRRAMKKALPDNLPGEMWELISNETFNGKCALRRRVRENVHLEHFIPLSIGHGGTFIGNVYPLCGELNHNKSAKNPFKWCEELTNQELKNFRELVKYLAKENGMTVELFEEYVNWCFDNPRTVGQVKADNERGMTSIDLFYESRSLAV